MTKTTTKFNRFFVFYRPLPTAPRVGYIKCGGKPFTMHSLYFFNRALMWHKTGR